MIIDTEHCQEGHHISSPKPKCGACTTLLYAKNLGDQLTRQAEQHMVIFDLKEENAAIKAQFENLQIKLEEEREKSTELLTAIDNVLFKFGDEYEGRFAELRELTDHYRDVDLKKSATECLNPGKCGEWWNCKFCDAQLENKLK